MSIPDDLQYTADHEWIRLEQDHATVGITEFAASALGDVVFVLAPKIGETVAAGQVCGEIESTKAVSEIVSPATGTVVEINEQLADVPDLVGSDPYGAGWLFRIALDAPVEALDAEAYRALTGVQ